MNEFKGPLQTVNYRDLFPWLHIVRAFRLALSFRKILLAALAVALLSAGDWAFSHLPFAPEPAAPQSWPWEQHLGYGADPLPVVDSAAAEPGRPRGLRTELDRFLTAPGQALWRIAANWSLILQPLRTLIDPARPLFDSGISWSETAYAWTRLLWGLIVWSVFGGAIVRMTAVQFAREQTVSLRSALRFSGEKFLSYLGAPLLAVAFFAVVWGLNLLAGLIARIPYFGEAVGMLWGLPLLLALMMALILVALAVGWPLMFATIGAEGSDAFDGFSRSYSLVYGWPWHYLWSALVVMVYGSVVTFVVWLFARLMVHLAAWSVGLGVGGAPQAVSDRLVPPVLGGRSPAVIADLSLGEQGIAVWLTLLGLLVVGFVYSYFWSAATIVYFLLRRNDDGTDLDDVFLGDEPEGDDLAEMAGMEESPTQETATPDKAGSPDDDSTV